MYTTVPQLSHNRTPLLNFFDMRGKKFKMNDSNGRYRALFEKKLNKIIELFCC